MKRLGYLGTIGKQVQMAAVSQPPPKNPEPVTVPEVIQIVEIPTIESEPVTVPEVEIPTIEPEPVSEPELELPPIQFQDEERYASPPILASIVSLHTESFSE